MEKDPETWCFKCRAIRTIIDPIWSVTANNRNICKGKCIECFGKVALMSGYATLPGMQFGKRSDNLQDDQQE